MYIYVILYTHIDSYAILNYDRHLCSPSFSDKSQELKITAADYRYQPSIEANDDLTSLTKIS